MDDRCKTCRHGDLRWDEEPCESCCGANDGYEPRGDRMDELISRQAAIDAIDKCSVWVMYTQGDSQKDEAEFVESIIKQTKKAIQFMLIEDLPSAQPKRGRWILNRSGAYCCSECMEPCAGYVMMQPRDRFCKMCGAKMEEE